MQSRAGKPRRHTHPAARSDLAIHHSPELLRVPFRKNTTSGPAIVSISPLRKTSLQVQAARGLETSGSGPLRRKVHIDTISRAAPPVARAYNMLLCFVNTPRDIWQRTEAPRNDTTAESKGAGFALAEGRAWFPSLPIERLGSAQQMQQIRFVRLTVALSCHSVRRPKLSAVPVEERPAIHEEPCVHRTPMGQGVLRATSIACTPGDISARGEAHSGQHRKKIQEQREYRYPACGVCSLAGNNTPPHGLGKRLALRNPRQVCSENFPVSSVATYQNKGKCPMIKLCQRLKRPQFREDVGGGR